MVDRVVEMLNINPSGVYVDGTAGGGGHSLAIGSRLDQDGRLICVDRDADAVEVCTERISCLKCHHEVIHSEYVSIPEILKEKNIKIDGLLLDLGVSSYQLDNNDRGFSYMVDGPLDMRMDQSKDFSASSVVNGYPEKDLERIFREYGEEKYSRSIAKAICSYRDKKKIETTFQLVEIIKSAIPNKALGQKHHPAKRVFQAIRIEVNDELGQLRELLNGIVDYFNPGGRIAIITFHSLEDRIVKQTFSNLANPCTCPKNIPVCVCGKKPKGRIVGDFVPSQTETELNPRARSSRLRIFEIHNKLL